MIEDTGNQTSDINDLASRIVSAYVSNNRLPPADLPDLIRTVHAALDGLASGTAPTAPEAEVEKPTAAQIRKSVTQNGIVSFLDGKSYKTLKRHLTGHGLDPQGYRARFGLPTEYPMVAPEYAARRSELAKSIGLGRVTDRSKAEQPRSKGSNKAA